jgi:hypothetical protein
MDPRKEESHELPYATPNTDRSFSVPHNTVNIQDALNQVQPVEQKTNTVRTFQSDVAGSVKSDNVSMIKIALAEKERREQEGNYFDVEVKRKNYKPTLLLILTICLVIGGAVGFVYWYFNKPPAPTLEERLAPREPTILYSETQSAVSVTNKNTDVILADLKKETLAKLDLGTVKRILITDIVGTSTINVNAQGFFKAIRSRAPQNLIRVIEPYFFIGAYSFAPHDVFIIFKINSYDTAYPAMLEWEKTLESDLGPLFVEAPKEAKRTENDVAPEVNQEQPVTTIGTDTAIIPESISTSTSSTQPIVKTTADTTGNIFKDKIIQNKDVRALVNPEGKILFMYTFLDRKTLIIISSEKGLKEVITRMTTGRIRR